MRIEVTGQAFTAQARAYAEYRVFASLARFNDVVREVKVSLTRLPAGSATRCAVAITTSGPSHTRVLARGRHTCDAINRAAARASDVVMRDRTSRARAVGMGLAG